MLRRNLVSGFLLSFFSLVTSQKHSHLDDNQLETVIHVVLLEGRLSKCLSAIYSNVQSLFQRFSTWIKMKMTDLPNLNLMTK